MNHITLPDKYLTADQHRLLGGWHDVLDDLRRLSRSLQAVPEDCGCGDGAGHLRGSCRCCHATVTDRMPDCGDCEDLLAQLRPLIDVLAVDTMRFFPVTTDVIHMQLCRTGIEPSTTFTPRSPASFARSARSVSRLTASAMAAARFT